MKSFRLPTLLLAVTAGCVDQPNDNQGTDTIQIERHANGNAYQMSGLLGQVDGTVTLATAQAQLAPALPAITSQLGVPSVELHATRVDQDPIGWTHVRMAQMKNGLPVESGEAIVHIDASNTIRSVDSGLVDRDLPSTPLVADGIAAQTAVSATTGAAGIDGNDLVYVVSNRDNQLYLAWRVVVVGAQAGLPVRDQVFVDALSGNVVDRHPRIFTAKNRTVRNGNNGVFPVTGATTVGTEAAPPTEAIALAAYTNTGLTYDCYKTLFNQDSYDNKGAPLVSQVHVVFDYGNGQTSPDNAMWAPDVAMMAYGDGDGTQMSPLARSLDVTAHELTHAVTSATSNLVYQNESGALNEAMSDIMGAVCQAWHDGAVSATTWQVGEDIWTPNTPGDALRYMDNPTKDGGSPDNYAERLTGTADNGGVHSNSGIQNLAFYLLSQGGNHPRAKTTVKAAGIGIDRAAQIMHRAQTQKWTANTNFASARTGAEAAANELYPGTCAKTAVSLAYAAVGVGTAPPADTAPPTVAIASPSNGSRVNAGFSIDVNTTDETCINKVDIKIDGVVVKTLTAAPYSFQTDTNLSNGSHTIDVVSYDAFNSSTASAQVTVGGSGGGGGGGNGGGGNGDSDVTGGCNTSGGGAGLLFGLGALGLALARRRR